MNVFAYWVILIATDDDFILIDDDDPTTEGIDIVNSVCFLDMHIACHMKETAEIKPEISLVNYYWIFVNQIIFSF